jgi:hypothetical protein
MGWRNETYWGRALQIGERILAKNLYVPSEHKDTFAFIEEICSSAHIRALHVFKRVLEENKQEDRDDLLQLEDDVRLSFKKVCTIKLSYPLDKHPDWDLRLYYDTSVDISGRSGHLKSTCPLLSISSTIHFFSKAAFKAPAIQSLTATP